jgi:hypothetical protein
VSRVTEAVVVEVGRRCNRAVRREEIEAALEVYGNWDLGQLRGEKKRYTRVLAQLPPDSTQRKWVGPLVCRLAVACHALEAGGAPA